jgi:hypothetical protein
MATVQLLNGPDVRGALERPGVALFRYRLNQLGFAVVLGFGAIMLGAAGYIWWLYEFDQNLWTAVFAGLAAGGLGLSLYAAYWYTFASTHFVGISDQRLVVGDEDKAWSIDWSVLDADSLGLTNMNATALGGALEISVGGEQIKLQLYNAYVYLEDMQAVMSGLLERLQDAHGTSDEQLDPDEQRNPEKQLDQA